MEKKISIGHNKIRRRNQHKLNWAAFMKYVIYLLFILALFSVNSSHAKTIQVGLHVSPPWSYINEEKEIVGIEKEIIEAVLGKMGYNSTFTIYSYSRLLKEIKDHRIDFASPVAFKIPNLHYTSNFVQFHDVAITRKGSGLTINTLEDLKDKHVVAYQHAKSVLGKDYEALAQNSMKSYKEIPERRNQLRMLFLNRADVVIGDIRTLSYIAKEIYGEDKIDIHPIFPETHYPAATWDKDLALKFTEIVNLYIESEDYQQLLKKYQ
tara:strand:+ start:4790 stop:5584 length:795 start_codon:yes stop_codon:yes gene_type:complete